MRVSSKICVVNCLIEKCNIGNDDKGDIQCLWYPSQDKENFHKTKIRHHVRRVMGLKSLFYLMNFEFEF